MAGYLAQSQARIARKRLRATVAELDALCDDVLRGATFDVVKAWFTNRLEPLA